jgi:3-methyladenine DNA glycosylase AlkD
MTSSAKAFADAVEAALLPLADTAQAAKMRAYLLGQFTFLGLPAPVRRKAVAPLVAQAWPSTRELLRAADLLWRKPEREYRYTAIDMLARHRRLLSLDALPHLRALIERDPWWETVDGLTSVISGIVLEQRGGQRTMDAWLTDDLFWIRRAAMLHQRGWRLDTDTERLFRYADTLAAEKEFFIRKAIGWALRDFARWHGDAVRQFVESRRDTLSPLSIREALKRM